MAILGFLLLIFGILGVGLFSGRWVACSSPPVLLLRASSSSAPPLFSPLITRPRRLFLSGSTHYTCSSNDADASPLQLAARLAELQSQIAELQELQADPLKLIASQQASLPQLGTRRELWQHAGSAGSEEAMGMVGAAMAWLTNAAVHAAGESAYNVTAWSVSAIGASLTTAARELAGWQRDGMPATSSAAPADADAALADAATAAAAMDGERRRLSSRLSGRFLKGGGGDDSEEGEGGGGEVTYCNPTQVEACAAVGGGCLYHNTSRADADFDSMMNAVRSAACLILVVHASCSVSTHRRL